MKNLFHTGRHSAKVILSFTIHFLILMWTRWIIVPRTHRSQLIVVALIEHLGDIVACEPISRRVRQDYPDAYILWMVKKEYRELIDSNPNIDAALQVHCLTEKEILKKSNLFDRLIDLHFSERHCALCPESWAGTADVRTPGAIGLSNFYDYGGILQSIERFAGLPPSDQQPRIYISDGVKRKVDALNLHSMFTVLHCSSNTPEKDWPREKWEALAGHLSREHRCTIIEVGLHPTLDNSGLGSYRNLTGVLSILETAEVIRRAKLFIGIDSGPAHLANAVGTFGIILLGSYLGFKKYVPFSGSYGNGSNASLLHTEGAVVNLPLERVLESVNAAFQIQSIS